MFKKKNYFMRKNKLLPIFRIDSGLTCFDAFLKTLDTWFDEITNYCLDRYSSGFVEGLNNKLKMIKRR